MREGRAQGSPQKLWRSDRYHAELQRETPKTSAAASK